MPEAPPSVEFRSVRKQFGRTLVTFLGPSGCGKTTTLRLIAGLERPTAGTILISGVDVTARPVAERDVSMVFQSYALFPHMSVLRNVAYGLVSDGRPRSQAEEMAREVLALVGMEGLALRLPSELSGGQQQRVAVARAIALRPAVLLLDEPLSNLDAKLRRRVRDEIRDLQQRLSLTAVYVTHDQAEAFAVSDRVIVMENANIAQDGSPMQLYREPASRFVAGFVGEANVVNGILHRRNDALGEVTLGDVGFELPHRGLRSGAVELAIRPEAVRISTEASACGLEGRIERAVFLGDRIEYHVETSIGSLFALDSDLERLFPQGAVVGVSFRLSGVALLPGPSREASSAAAAQSLSDDG